MKHIAAALIALTATTTIANEASAQSARAIRGVSPYEDHLRNQPPPKLVVDPPLQEPLKSGVFQAQYRVENLRIVPIFGPEAAKVIPRAGHLHIIVDDHPFWWADASDSNTVDIANLAPGPHKVTIRLVDPNHTPVPGQEATLHFTIPPYASFEPKPVAERSGGRR